MSGKSNGLLEFRGPNPFREAQARTFSDDKIIREFFITSNFLSLFNEQHEILLGTRGSGKTALLRMLSYSRLRKVDDERILPYTREKHYIGFYVPLHLEFMSALAGRNYPAIERREYFQFAFNCSAIDALLSELVSLLDDCKPDNRSRVITESEIVDKLVQMWFPDKINSIGSIEDLRWQINLLYHSEAFWADGERDNVPLFADPILSPILSVLPIITRKLGLNVDETHWVACIDEAEWLEGPFIQCINTFMRSERRPLVVKMATLPFEHNTRETVIDGLMIEPDGNDFNYRVVDMDWHSIDFEMFSNHICNVRLERCDIEVASLDDFLGREGRDQGLDYFRLEVGNDDATEEQLLSKIIPLLSEARRKRYERIKNDTQRVRDEYLLKFSPIYYVRRMREMNRKAARKVGWFSGAKIFRQVADGNPRRFIQLMNDVFEVARKQELTPKHQHQAVFDFCTRAHQASEGLPEFGHLVETLISKIGDLLQQRVHGFPMFDGGCGFMVSEHLLERDDVVQALELALNYSHIIADDKTARSIKSTSVFRLAYVHGVHFWLPLRKSTPVIIQANQVPAPDSSNKLLEKRVMTRTLSQELTSQFQLRLFDDE